MKTFFFSVLVLTSTFSFGQFLNKNNKWNDLKTNCLLLNSGCIVNCSGCTYTTHSYSLTRDTIIDGKNYVVLLDSIYERFNINDPIQVSSQKVGWLREEDKKIYYLQSLVSSNIETLIYDFNLKINDVFSINYTVYKTDTIEYYGTRRNTIYLKNPYDSVTWIDGIGATNNFLGYETSMPLNMLLCFKQDNILQYKNDMDLDCIYASVDIGQKVNELYNSQIKISPNPALNIVSIKSDKKISHIEILSVSGKIINTYKPNGNDYTVDISNLPKGFYFIRINNNMTEKIIKE